jgi:hypothetical protein
MSAAPAAVSGGATVLDWPTADGGAPIRLRAGTNGWTCFPSNPQTLAGGRRDPMCLDGPSMALFQAYMTHGTPKVSHVGFIHMLQGDGGASNTDPDAVAATPDNQWVVSGPHVMIVVPDPRALADLPTDPSTGGPFVMWKGTPFAHVMLPVKP